MGDQNTMSAALGLRPVYKWSRPGRFGRPFYSELHTIGRYPDGQIVWQGTEIAWLGTKGAETDEFMLYIRQTVRERLRKRQPAALRNLPPNSVEVLLSIADGDMTHFHAALEHARAWSPLDS